MSKSVTIKETSPEIEQIESGYGEIKDYDFETSWNLYVELKEKLNNHAKQYFGMTIENNLIKKMEGEFCDIVDELFVKYYHPEKFPIKIRRQEFCFDINVDGSARFEFVPRVFVLFKDIEEKKKLDFLSKL